MENHSFATLIEPRQHRKSLPLNLNDVRVPRVGRPNHLIPVSTCFKLCYTCSLCLSISPMPSLTRLSLSTSAAVCHMRPLLVAELGRYALFDQICSCGFYLIFLALPVCRSSECDCVSHLVGLGATARHSSTEATTSTPRSTKAIPSDR